MIRDIATLVAGLLGLILIGFGVWLIHQPSSMIVVGTLLIAWSYVVAKSGVIQKAPQG